MSICRVCHEFESTRRLKGDSCWKLIKYSTRHYAHADCALKKWGSEFFQRLTPWQCNNQFPYFVAKKLGFRAELEQRAALDDTH